MGYSAVPPAAEACGSSRGCSCGCHAVEPPPYIIHHCECQFREELGKASLGRPMILENPPAGRNRCGYCQRLQDPAEGTTAGSGCCAGCGAPL